MTFDEFGDTLDGLATARNLEDLTKLCRAYCLELDFDHFVYALRMPTQFSEARVIVIDGYPDAWVDHYWEQGHAGHDPVIAYCSQHITPIEWHRLSVDPDSPAARVMQEAADFGLRNGISTPVHSPGGELGILSFATALAGEPAYELTRRARPYMQILAAHVHEATHRILDAAESDQPVRLTARETECLRWTADGKTSWEISLLLGMSERTVNFHLNNAMIKLDASNRQHAVAKAVLRGLINPLPF